MKIAVAQLNPTVGDVGENVSRILKAASRAESRGAELVIFPELAVTGYPPRDLLLVPEFAKRVAGVYAEAILPASENIGILVGIPSWEGEWLYNSALLCYHGRLAGRQDKTLLPNYDVFDESRYFRPARARRPSDFKGHRIGVTICEDIWNDKDYWHSSRYEIDPVEDLVQQGADVIVNLSASPYHFGKLKTRTEMLTSMARKYGKPFLFVNQVGGNDELVFDGSSLVCDADGEIIWMGKSFEEDFTVVDIDADRGVVPAEVVDEDIDCLYDALVVGTRDYMRKTGFKKAVIGLSGGIDSSVTAAVAAAAVSAQNVLGVAMPSRYSSPESLEDARQLSRNLGTEFRCLPIDEVFSSYLNSLSGGAAVMDTAEENLQARMRGNMLMFISNREGHLVLSTGNKSEMAVGYSTLYGDMSGGLAVLADVPKTMVYRLAEWINRGREVIPSRVLTKPPSAELRPDQTDEDSLPPYPVLDPILKLYVEENMSRNSIARQGFDERVVKEVLEKVDRAEFKRKQAPPGLRVTSKAFGPGRRFPIAWRPG